MFGTRKVKYYMNANFALRLFKDYQKSVFESTGNLVVVTKVLLVSYDTTIISYKIIKPKDGPAKELSEARKHINNAKIMLGAWYANHL